MNAPTMTSYQQLATWTSQHRCTTDRRVVEVVEETSTPLTTSNRSNVSCRHLLFDLLSPVHTSNNVEATFDFVERIIQLVAFDNVAWTLLLVWTGPYTQPMVICVITHHYYCWHHYTHVFQYDFLKEISSLHNKIYKCYQTKIFHWL